MKMQPNTTMASVEKQCWEALKNGDQQALDYFYQTYVGSLYNYGKKVTSDAELIKDCIQELFIDLWRNHDHLTNPASLKFYLLKALRYKILRQLKKEYPPQLERAEMAFGREAPVPSHEHEMIARQMSEEQQQKMQRELEKLTQRQREAIVLKFYEAMSYEEVAEIMALKPQSVYNLIHQAIHILKKSMNVEISFMIFLTHLIFTLINLP